jgi:hypothetical protein
MNTIDDIQRSLPDLIAAVAGRQFLTPSGRRTFTIMTANRERVVVVTERAHSKIMLPVSAFEQVMAYLIGHGHGLHHPCFIRSHNNPEQGSDLCRVARGGTGQRKITYVLPILQHLGLVRIDTSVRPMTTCALMAIDSATRV